MGKENYCHHLVNINDCYRWTEDNDKKSIIAITMEHSELTYERALK